MKMLAIKYHRLISSLCLAFFTAAAPAVGQPALVTPVQSETVLAKMSKIRDIVVETRSTFIVEYAIQSEKQLKIVLIGPVPARPGEDSLKLNVFVTGKGSQSAIVERGNYQFGFLNFWSETDARVNYRIQLR